MRNYPRIEGMTFENMFELNYFQELNLEIDGYRITNRQMLEEISAQKAAAEENEEAVKQLPAFQALKAYNAALLSARTSIKSVLQFHRDARIFNTDEALTVQEPNPILRDINPMHPDGGMILANSKTHSPDFESMNRLREFLVDIHK